MAASEKYVSCFTSIEGNEYVIWVTTDRPIVNEPNTEDGTTPTREFTLKEPGFELEYQNDGDDIFSPIRTSSLRFSWEMREGTNDLSEFNTIVTNTDQTWYVTLLKNDALDWFGYLNLENFAQPYTSPTAVELEAVDPLTLSKDIKLLQDVWKGTICYSSSVSPGRPVIYGGDGFGNRFLFGREDTPNNHILVSSSPRADVGMATLIEMIWSLLYDLEDVSSVGLLNPIGSNAGPGGLSVMIKYDHISRLGTNGIWDEVAAQIYPYVYKDYRTTDALTLTQSGEAGNYTIGDILENILNLWNCRVFLSDGRYWVVQYRTYADTPFISSDYSENLSNPTATSPTRDSIESSTLPNISNNTITVDSGNTHYLMATPQIEYRNKLQSFTVEHYYASGKKKVKAFVDGVESNNLTGINLEQDEANIDFNPVTDTILDNSGGNTIHEGDYYLLNSGSNWQQVSLFDETGSSGSYYSLAQLMAFGRVQARNAVNIKLKATIISPELSYFQPIVFATQRYVANEFTRFGSTDEVRGSWIRLNLSNTDITLEDQEVEE